MSLVFPDPAKAGSDAEQNSALNPISDPNGNLRAVEFILPNARTSFSLGGTEFVLSAEDAVNLYNELGGLLIGRMLRS